MTGDLPTLVTDPWVVELSENNAPRACTVCGDGADYYVYVTHERPNNELDTDRDPDEWVVNAFLCRQHFREAPRVDSLEDHPALA